MEKKKTYRKRRKTEVPEPTLRRLPLYLHFLEKIWEGGQINVSAPTIGLALDYDPTQVVKDIAATGCVGKPKVGYNTYELIRSIEDFLGFNTKNEAVLVGAGNLGSALLAYNNLQGFGIKIIAAFDIDPNKVGTQIGNISVMHITKLEELIKRLNIKIAILTTPASISQDMADTMVTSGIRAIWNFSPLYLQVTDDVIVQNTSMYSNVAVLLKKLKEVTAKKEPIL